MSGGRRASAPGKATLFDDRLLDRHAPAVLFAVATTAPPRSGLTMKEGTYRLVTAGSYRRPDPGNLRRLVEVVHDDILGKIAGYA
ncbi:hypothetical protein IP79_07730 [Porphyrobacter sp. AAP60]|nr:hypothetical protein IP79_07730 [Porphyrobacter sp. AAP60]